MVKIAKQQPVTVAQSKHKAPEAIPSSGPSQPVAGQVPTFVNLEKKVHVSNGISHRDLMNVYIHSQCPAAVEVSPSAARIDVANLSGGTDAIIETIGWASDLPITKATLVKYKDKIGDWLRPPKDHKSKEYREYLARMKKKGAPDDLPEVFSNLEALTARGIPVFLSAGNGGPRQVNLYGFAKGVISVGALDAQGHKTSYTADNPLITMWKRGDYPVVSVLNKKKELIGFNITGTGNQTPDVKLKQLLGIESTTRTDLTFGDSTFNGTSISSALSAGQLLLQKYGEACFNKKEKR